MEHMATALNLDRQTLFELDDLVARGRFASREDVVREALRLVWEDEVDDGPLTQAEREGIERGLADVEAGRLVSSAAVRAELERRHAAGL